MEKNDPSRALVLSLVRLGGKKPQSPTKCRTKGHKEKMREYEKE